MPGTHSVIDRDALEVAILEQLRKEAKKLHFPTTGDRTAVIDVNLNHVVQLGSAADSPEAGAPAAEEPLTASSLREILTQMQSVIREQRELQESFLRQQMEMQLQQQQFMLQLVQQLTERGWAKPSGTEREVAPRTGRSSDEAPGREGQAGSPSSAALANGNSVGSTNVHSYGDITVELLATQIPEFGGGEDENVNVWVKRVDIVSVIHRATDGVILLAASSKLVKLAKQWYELKQDGIESWDDLKRELMKMFKRGIYWFYKTMQKVEARKWNPGKESFDQYALAKQSLIHPLDLPVKDAIHLIIGGIKSGTLRAAALSIAGDSLGDFLGKMRIIAEGFVEPEKKV